MIFRRLVGALRLAYLFLDRIAVIGVRQASDEQRVLVVRVDAIGDFVMWVDAAREIRNQFTGKRLYLVGNSVWSEWAAGLGVADELIALDHRRFLQNPVYRWKFLRMIRRLGSEVCIQPTYSRELFVGDAIVRASAAARRIGSVGDFSNMRWWHKWIGDRSYSELIPAANGTMMEIKRNAEFVRGLGVAGFPARIASLTSVAAMPRDSLSDEPYFIVFPGASWDGKKWPLERYVDLAARIHNQTGWNCVICGGRNEVGAGSELVHRLGGFAESRAGTTDLAELAESILGAQLLVGNDTGAIHIAAAVGTPAVCVLGGGAFGRFLPYDIDVKDDSVVVPRAVAHEMPCFGCNWRCVYSRAVSEPMRCIDSISVESVWAEVRAVVDSLKGRGTRKRWPPKP